MQDKLMMSVCQTIDWHKRLSLPYKEPKTMDWVDVEKYTITEVSHSDMIQVLRLWVCKESTDILTKYL